MNPTIDEIFGWAVSGQGRLMAAALLFGMIALIERVPVIKPWLNVNGWQSGKDAADAWLTSKRKKLVANIILASGPMAALIAGGADWHEVAMTAVSVALMAAGFNAKVSSLFPKAMDAKRKLKLDEPALEPEPEAEQPEGASER